MCMVAGNMTLQSLRLPRHVRAIQWAPQNDVLAAKATKVFVTHCGVNSLQEAAYHGTPIVAVPFLADQPYNAAKVSHLHCQLWRSNPTLTKPDWGLNLCTSWLVSNSQLIDLFHKWRASDCAVLLS